jgi:uncharacterized membrane protein YfcA
LDAGHLVLLGLIGLFVGVFGTLIGAAGGFILVPILLFLYPGERPPVITSITLTVAFLNAVSGSLSYARLRRIDYRSGLVFALTSVPAAVVGARLTSLLDRGLFQAIFGILLLLVSAYLLVRPAIRRETSAGLLGHTRRQLIDSDGHHHSYSFNLPIGIAISFHIGMIGGLLGLGGGIMHVPALTQLLGFPIHIATATSHFVVAITTLAAVITHIIQGTFAEGASRALVLAVGAVIGAPFGARLSQKVPGSIIIRLLAIGLAIVAARLLIAPF